MSKLEKLIQQYCPDGVEWKPLGELGDFYSGLSGKTKSDFTGGNEKFITYVNVFNNPSLKTDVPEKVKIAEGERQNTIQYGDILFTGSSETPDECGMSSVLTHKTEEKLYLNSFCFGFRFYDLSDKCPSFMKYLFRSTNIRKAICKTANGVTRYNISKKEFAKIEIPIIPLPVQEEIVRVLDTFTELQAELQAELQKRKQQYNFYLDNLLNFKNINRGGQAEVRWMKLKNVCMKTSNIKWKSTTGQYRYIDLSSVDIQTHSIISTIEIDKMSAPSRAQQIVQEDDVIFATTRPTQMRACIIPTEYNGDICSTGYCILRADRNILLPKFLFFSMTTSTFKIYLSNNLTLGNYPSISNSALMGYEIPVPPIAEQQKIVSILDRFDTLTNDLTSGLPAEMEKRRQQYEFYRDKLLTFKRKEA